VRTFFAQLAESVDFKRFQPREFVSERDKVVALGFYEAAAKKTGRAFQSEWVMAFTIANGKVVKFREFADATAINAAF
jgi:ketosteroid isomerase-like protein